MAGLLGAEWQQYRAGLAKHRVPAEVITMLRDFFMLGAVTLFDIMDGRDPTPANLQLIMDELKAYREELKSLMGSKH